MSDRSLLCYEILQKQGNKKTVVAWGDHCMACKLSPAYMAIDFDDVYFWKKTRRPCPEKDHVRHSIAAFELSHLKTQGTVLKSVHQDPNKSCYKAKNDLDLTPYLIYSLNKKRRWEAEDNIGVKLLDKLRKLNHGWNVMVLERVKLRAHIWPLFTYATMPYWFGDKCMIRSVHELNDDDGYKKTTLNSIFGQRYSHFVKENREPNRKKRNGSVEVGKVIPKDQDPLLVYNFIRAPTNYMELLKKHYRSSRCWWESPHIRYSRRLERFENICQDLRYDEVESDVDQVYFSDLEEAPDHLQPPRSQFYNLEYHFVDKFVIVKGRRNKSRRADL